MLDCCVVVFVTFAFFAKISFFFFSSVLVVVLETARRKRQNTTEVDKWNIHHGIARTRLVDGVMALESILNDNPDVISP